MKKYRLYIEFNVYIHIRNWIHVVHNIFSYISNLNSFKLLNTLSRRDSEAGEPHNINDNFIQLKFIKKARLHRAMSTKRERKPGTY